MLLSPVVLDTLAQGTVDYSNLDIATWGSDNTAIEYETKKGVRAFNFCEPMRYDNWRV